MGAGGLLIIFISSRKVDTGFVGFTICKERHDLNFTTLSLRRDTALVHLYYPHRSAN